MAFSISEAMPVQDWCDFPSWCPWTSMTLCWSLADCDFDIGDRGGGDDGSGSCSMCGCDECLERCQTEYQQNLDDCDGSIACVNAAAAEKRACQASCMTDFVDCEG